MKTLRCKAHYFMVLFALWLLLCTSLFASSEKVFDGASLFTSEQIETLEQTIATIGETYQMDVGIVTTNDVQGKSSSQYSEDFYEAHGYGYGSDYTGLLLLINMEDREVWIATCGEAIAFFTDSRIDATVEAVTNQLKEGNYFKSALAFLSKVDATIQKGIPSNQHMIYEESARDVIDYRSKLATLTATDILLRFLIALLIAFVGSSLICVGIRYRYKHPSHHLTPTVPDRSSIQFTDKKDQFVRTYTTRIKVESSNNGGGSGGSSTHSSSSGRSYGGGGGKF